MADVAVAPLARGLFEARMRAMLSRDDRFLCSGLLSIAALGRRSNQRFTSGDVKGVPDSTSEMSGSIRRTHAFVKRDPCR